MGANGNSAGQGGSWPPRRPLRYSPFLPVRRTESGAEPVMRRKKRAKSDGVPKPSSSAISVTLRSVERSSTLASRRRKFAIQYPGVCSVAREMGG